VAKTLVVPAARQSLRINLLALPWNTHRLWSAKIAVPMGSGNSNVDLYDELHIAHFIVVCVQVLFDIVSLVNKFEQLFRSLGNPQDDDVPSRHPVLKVKFLRNIQSLTNGSAATHVTSGSDDGTHHRLGVLPSSCPLLCSSINDRQFGVTILARFFL
jgi:hypothetical protein